jgi:hypothetical protein
LLQKTQRNEIIMLLVSPLLEPVTGLPGSCPAFEAVMFRNLVQA